MPPTTVQPQRNTTTKPHPSDALVPSKKRGAKPKPIVEFPEPDSTIWMDPETFEDALKLHLVRHGDSVGHLHKAISQANSRTDRKTIANWAAGIKTPRTVESMAVLARIERRYRLPMG